jgi:hypothetical protein
VSARVRASRHPLDELSFVALRDGKTLPKPTGDQLPRCFWNVTPTGDYGLDCKVGRALALEYLALLETDPYGRGELVRIVKDMPCRLTGVEVAFLDMVDCAAGAGAYRARQRSAYYDSREAEMEAAEAQRASRSAKPKRKPSGESDAA